MRSRQIVISREDYETIRRVADPRLRKDAEGRYIDPLPPEDDPSVRETDPIEPKED